MAELGWRTHDADGICHALLADAGGDVSREVRARFGDAVVGPDGCIDRTVLGQTVLDDDAGREWLESLLHPRILERVLEERIRAAEGGNTVFDIPLLFEVRWERHFESTVLVYADLEERVARLALKGVPEARARAFIGFQMPLEEKMVKAGHVLVNNGSKEILQLQCERLDIELSALYER